MALRLLLFAMFRTMMMLLWHIQDKGEVDVTGHISTLDLRWLAYDEGANPYPSTVT